MSNWRTCQQVAPLAPEKETPECVIYGWIFYRGPFQPYPPPPPSTHKEICFHYSHSPLHTLGTPCPFVVCSNLTFSYSHQNRNKKNAAGPWNPNEWESADRILGMVPIPLFFPKDLCPCFAVHCRTCYGPFHPGPLQKWGWISHWSHGIWEWITWEKFLCPFCI